MVCQTHIKLPPDLRSCSSSLYIIHELKSLQKGLNSVLCVSSNITLSGILLNGVEVVKVTSLTRRCRCEVSSLGALNRDPRNSRVMVDESCSGAGAGETRERSDSTVCKNQLYSYKTSHIENTLEKEKLLKCKDVIMFVHRK